MLLTRSGRRRVPAATPSSNLLRPTADAAGGSPQQQGCACRAHKQCIKGLGRCRSTLCGALFFSFLHSLQQQDVMWLRLQPKGLHVPTAPAHWQHDILSP